MDIRKRILKNDRNLPQDDPEAWLKEIPKNTRVESIRCFLKDMKTSYSNLKNGNITHFERRYLSKKYNSDIFHIASNELSSNLRLFKKRLDAPLRMPRRCRRWLKENESSIFGTKTSKDGKCYQRDKLLHTASITRSKDGSYYLIVCYTTTKTLSDNIIDDIVALDPGVRTFQTFFSERSQGKLGDGFYVSRIKKINEKIDYLTSKRHLSSRVIVKT